MLMATDCRPMREREPKLCALIDALVAELGRDPIRDETLDMLEPDELRGMAEGLLESADAA